MLVLLGTKELDSNLSHRDERDLHDLGKVFWQEMDPGAGVKCELMAVDTFFSHDSGRVILVGLHFRYTYSLEHQFGCCTASLNTTMESVELRSDKVVYFERRRGRRDARVPLSLVVSVSHAHTNSHFSYARNEDSRDLIFGGETSSMPF